MHISDMYCSLKRNFLYLGTHQFSELFFCSLTFVFSMDTSTASMIKRCERINPKRVALRETRCVHAMNADIGHLHHLMVMVSHIQYYNTTTETECKRFLYIFSSSIYLG